MKIPKFDTKKELFAWLRENKDDIIYQKQASLKEADYMECNVVEMKGLIVSKVADGDVTELKRRLIINTTNIRDSHKDVHLDGLWDDDLETNKRMRLLKEHNMTFDDTIADKGDLKAFTQKYNWRDLGKDADGETEALVFDVTIKQARHGEMFIEYKQGNVDNHSVGMYYKIIKFAMDSDEEEDKDLKAEYDKHIDKIVNRDEVDKDGYYWAVYKAVAVEGSAVPNGSNPITPTLPQTKRKTKIVELSKDEKMVETIKAWLTKPS